MLYYNAKILKVNDLFELKVDVYLYKYEQCTLNDNLRSIMAPTIKQHDYDTRQSNVIYTKTKELGRLARLYWSYIPDKIKDVKTIESLKKKTKANSPVKICHKQLTMILNGKIVLLQHMYISMFNIYKIYTIKNSSLRHT